MGWGGWWVPLPYPTLWYPTLTIPHPILPHLEDTPPSIIPHPLQYPTFYIPHLQQYPTFYNTPPFAVPHPLFYPTLYFTPPSANFCHGSLSGGTSLKNNFSQGAWGWVLALRAKTQPRDAWKKLFFKELLTIVDNGSLIHLDMCGSTSNQVLTQARLRA